MTTITVHADNYENHPVTRINLDGKPTWLAREIGRVLGYASQGDKLARNITARWTDDFTEGVDYAYLSGDLLHRLRRLVPRLRRTRRVLVLYRSGLEKVLARVPFEIAFPLRSWIDDRLPTANGGPAPSTQASDSLLEERRLRIAETREHRLASEQRALGMLLLLDAISEPTSDSEFQVYQIKMAQELAGRDFTSLLPPKETDWSTPTQIARRNGTNLNRIGRIISRLGLRDPATHPDLVEAYDNLAPGSGRVVTCFRYSPDAVAWIEQALAEEDAPGTGELFPDRSAD